MGKTIPPVREVLDVEETSWNVSEIAAFDKQRASGTPAL
jgi:hypothetical protein